MFIFYHSGAFIFFSFSFNFLFYFIYSFTIIFFYCEGSDRAYFVVGVRTMRMLPRRASPDTQEHLYWETHMNNLKVCSTVQQTLMDAYCSSCLKVDVIVNSV